MLHYQHAIKIACIILASLHKKSYQAMKNLTRGIFKTFSEFFQVLHHLTVQRYQMHVIFPLYCTLHFILTRRAVLIQKDV